MISSSCLDIVTPRKECVFSDFVTPKKQAGVGRDRVSESESRVLDQLKRSHEFLMHEQIVYCDLKEYYIDVKTADLLSRYLQKKIDIPDAILRMEEIACKQKYYTDFLTKYIAEEFKIQEHYSFCVIALLHYCKSKHVCLDDAITELIFLSSKEAICVKCCSEGITIEDKIKIVNHHNLSILKSMDYEISSEEEDIYSDDDSVKDPPYKGDEEHSWSSDEFSYSNDEDNCEDRRKNVTTCGGFNPFDSSEDEEEVEVVTSRPRLNSSISFNPFDEEDAKKSLISSGRKKIISCEHCGKVFSNSHNMKMHVIGVHKICPLGMTMFNCSVASCSFATGSQIMLQRHMNTHSKNKKPNKPDDSKCFTCAPPQTFYNKGSLKRHKERFDH